MLVGLSGALAGYDGNFDFESGFENPEDVPYVAMRVFLATFGMGMVSLSWYTVVELGMSQWASHLVALMVLLGTLFKVCLKGSWYANTWHLDVGWLCISRFILLDSMLFIFTFLTVFYLTKFHHQQYQ